MKDVSDVISWIVGVLGALVLVNWRMDKKSDNEKFKTLFDGQRKMETKVGKAETKIEAIKTYHIQVLEDIKSQNTEMAKDVTKIKIAIASLPKRKAD